MKQIMIQFTFIIWFIGNQLSGQPAFPNSPNQAPIGGLGVLAIIGGAMAIKRFYDLNKK